MTKTEQEARLFQQQERQNSHEIVFAYTHFNRWQHHLSVFIKRKYSFRNIVIRFRRAAERKTSKNVKLISSCPDRKEIINLLRICTLRGFAGDWGKRTVAYRFFENLDEAFQNDAEHEQSNGDGTLLHFRARFKLRDVGICKEK